MPGVSVRGFRGTVRLRTPRGIAIEPARLHPPDLEGKLRTIDHFCDVALTLPPELQRLVRHLLRLEEFSVRLDDRKRARPYADLARHARQEPAPAAQESQGGVPAVAVPRDERHRDRLPEILTALSEPLRVCGQRAVGGEMTEHRVS